MRFAFAISIFVGAHGATLAGVKEYEHCQTTKATGWVETEKSRMTKTGSNPECTETVAESATTARTITVYFVRHAESTWNQVTDNDNTVKKRLEGNGGKDADYAYLRDAVLSEEGVKSAYELGEEIAKGCLDKKDPNCDSLNFLAGQENANKDRKAIFAVSNLRRAVMTALLAFRHRILTPEGKGIVPIENMYVLSYLQETAKNTDSIPLGDPKDIPILDFKDKADSKKSCPFSRSDMEKFFILQCDDAKNENAIKNSGFSLFKKQEMDRFAKFCKWVTKKVNEDKYLTDMVVTGHSMWLRQFFKKYDDVYFSKLSSIAFKVGNDAILEFRLQVTAKGKGCRIVRGSTKMIRGDVEFRWAKYAENMKKGIINIPRNIGKAIKNAFKTNQRGDEYTIEPDVAPPI